MGNCFCLGTKINNKQMISSDDTKKMSKKPRTRSEGDILQSSAKVRSLSFVELRSSTRNFRPDSVLGEDHAAIQYNTYRPK
ncbi:unnamed protein product [Urochloa humidicola]